MKTEQELFAETPYECSYDLAMFDHGGSGVQEFSLTRDEFLALKVHLAKLRGIHVEPEDDSTTKKKADREHVINFLRDKIHDCHLTTALRALELIERNTGCNTPAEDFMCSLIRDSVEGLTPGIVRDALEQFDEEFAWVAKNCEYTSRFYPDIIAAAEAGKI